MSELNKVDGNIMLIPLCDIDTYHCKECDKDVVEEEFNNKRNMCYSCWWSI